MCQIRSMLRDGKGHGFYDLKRDLASEEPIGHISQERAEPVEELDLDLQTRLQSRISLLLRAHRPLDGRTGH